MEVTDRTDSLWEDMLMSFTDSPAKQPQRHIGIARVRELAAQLPITQPPVRSLTEVLTDAAAREGYGPAQPGSRRDAYYAETYGGDWPEDH